MSQSAPAETLRSQGLASRGERGVRPGWQHAGRLAASIRRQGILHGSRMTGTPSRRIATEHLLRKRTLQGGGACTPEQKVAASPTCCPAAQTTGLLDCGKERKEKHHHIWCSCRRSGSLVSAPAISCHVYPIPNTCPDRFGQIEVRLGTTYLLK